MKLKLFKSVDFLFPMRHASLNAEWRSVQMKQIIYMEFTYLCYCYTVY